MPLPVLFAPLVLTLASAWLVFLQGWEAREAMLTVGITAVLAIVGLIGATLLLIGRESRTEIWRIFRNVW